MVIAVASGVLATLRQEAARAAPHECCGLLLGCATRIETAVPATNVHPDPARHFEIDPAALIAAHKSARNGGMQVVGYYHSHPGGDPRPSHTDAALAPGDGRIWAIVAGDDVQFWRDTGGSFAAVAVQQL